MFTQLTGSRDSETCLSNLLGSELFPKMFKFFLFFGGEDGL